MEINEMSRRVAAQRFRLFIFAMLLCGPAGFAQRTPANPPAVEQLLREAGEQAQPGNLAAATAVLRKAGELAPGNVDALSGLGGLLGMQGRLDESTRLFERALRLDPASPDLRRNLAANQLRLGRIAAARANLEALLKAHPGDREAILMLGFACERGQDYARAVALLEQVPELVQRYPDHVLALARAYYRTGQKQKARSQLAPLLEAGADPAAGYLAGLVGLEAGDGETAEKLFLAVRPRHPKPSLVSYQLARIQYQAGRYEACRLLLEPIANSPESDGTVLNLLAWCYLKEGDEATAVKILSYATDKFPAEAANFTDLGKLMLKGKRLRAGEAVPHLEKAAELDPGNAQAHFVLSRAYRALGRTEDSEREAQLFKKLERR